MATPTLLSCRRPVSSLQKPTQTPVSSYPTPLTIGVASAQLTESPKSINCRIFQNKKAMAALLGAGFALTLVGPVSAAELPLLGSSLLLNEPSNALSLPTWAIHVSSVVEWITAMALVWQYGEKSGNESWKGLSWGMVPLLGGAFCACTWHFFYNSEALEILSNQTLPCHVSFFLASSALLL
ncbi:uncharacterized protein LOC130753466 isoform X3 [Actinidia eriantha]|uniref:uncharacterized protein LOC130753466 isoform X3 n=1 Tax=Actinidia eriantha TaxID=165200 RepID=UPI00258B8ED6|nr:uncharacterized protein LOC130753466 isoform X3 [Actinidia eriantha]